MAIQWLHDDMLPDTETVQEELCDPFHLKILLFQLLLLLFLLVVMVVVVVVVLLLLLLLFLVVLTLQHSQPLCCKPLSRKGNLVNRQTSQIDRQTDRQTYKETDRQTDRHTHQQQTDR